MVKLNNVFFRRIRDHIRPILKKKIVTAVSRHVAIYHNFDPSVISFVALDHIPPDSKEGSVDSALLQLEVWWIYNLKTTCYPGFNENLSFKPFL